MTNKGQTWLDGYRELFDLVKSGHLDLTWPKQAVILKWMTEDRWKRIPPQDQEEILAEARSMYKQLIGGA